MLVKDPLLPINYRLWWCLLHGPKSKSPNLQMPPVYIWSRQVKIKIK